MKRFSFTIFFTFLFAAAKAQAPLDAQAWFHIDTSIQFGSRLSETLAMLNQMEKKAENEKRYFDQARCIYSKIRIADKRTEDSFYFKNSAILDTLLGQNQPPQLTYCLHMLLAKRLYDYDKNYRYYNYQRYERTDIPVNYAKLSEEQQDSIIEKHFGFARQTALMLDKEDAGKVLWLSSNPLQFLFKPTLHDIVMAEQVQFAKKDYRLFNTDSLKHWLSLAPDEFIVKLKESLAAGHSVLKPDATTMTKEESKLEKYFVEWLEANKAKTEAYYYIESLVHKQAYEQYNGDYPENTNNYEVYLKGLTNSGYNVVKTHGVFQLCMLWYKQGLKYFPEKKYTYDEETGQNDYQYQYDTAYRMHPAKALNLFYSHRLLLDSFAVLKERLEEMERLILKSEHYLTMESTVLPGKQLLAELKFKNTDTLYYRIVKEPVVKDPFFYTDENLIDRLLALPVVENSILMPGKKDDHNYHNLYMKLPGQQTGAYTIIMSRGPVTDTAYERHITHFSVSNIAMLNYDKRIYVLHRKTGKPLAGAKVTAAYSEGIVRDGKYQYKTQKRNMVVNSRGFVDVPGNKFNEITIAYGNDTLTSSANFTENDWPDDVYSKHEYDNLLEYYEDKAEVHVYTDRSIYRPGQTVHYKAIFLTKNPKTGALMVMNKKNLKGKIPVSIYNKIFKREEDAEMYITDPFGHEVDTINFLPNDYGSVTGEFKLPKTAPTGKWKIASLLTDENSGTFKVEEYKRPSYEINIDKTIKELRLKDTFSFTVKVKSFAGAPLNNVRIKYKLERTGDIPAIDSITGKDTAIFVQIIMADTTAFTDGNGQLEIKVNDTACKNYRLFKDKYWFFNYIIHAEAIDASGESYTAEEMVRLNSSPLYVNVDYDAKQKLGSMQPLKVDISDENFGKVETPLDIKLYKITKPLKPVSGRELKPADTWLYNKETLQKEFEDEDILRQHKKEEKLLVAERTVEPVKGKLSLDSMIKGTGHYEIELEAKENGDIAGNTSKTFTVFETGQHPEGENEFYYLKEKWLQAGKREPYYFGARVPDIYSIFHTAYFAKGNKIKTTYSYTEKQTGSGINEYTLQVPANAVGSMKLNHLFIYNNHLYKNNEEITIEEKKEAEPEIIVEKYRSRLAPGSKETFTISIKTKNENKAAELLTAMYDASLDKIEPHSWEKPYTSNDWYIRDGWQTTLSSLITSYMPREYNPETDYLYPARMGRRVEPLWWLDPLDYAYRRDGLLSNQRMYSWSFDGGAALYNGNVYLRVDSLGNAMSYVYYDSNASGTIDYLSSSGTTYNYTTLAGAAYAVRFTPGITVPFLQIRGLASSSGLNKPLIILDGVVYSGSLESIDEKTLKGAAILKGADATALYGAAGANGVMLLSTKGEIKFPLQPEPVIMPRKNFNETAFFFPKVYADKNGYYTFTFTMPESVTQWRWLMLAHTKSALFATAEKTLYTQLPLMVQPNMPRALYQGDKMVLQSRITNLDTLNASGTAICKVEDAVTGEDLTEKISGTTKKDFAIAAKQNKSVAFTLTVPSGQTTPLKVTITARSQNFADGEEHIIPVLSRQIFVRKNTPFVFVAKDTIISLPALPPASMPFGTGLSVKAQQKAALINSLADLITYPHSCAEQTFTKIQAYVTANELMRTDEDLKKGYETLRADIEKTKTEDLPDELAEESMPWLKLNNQKAQQQKKLFQLLDSSGAASKIDELMEHIYKLQNSDGGITWFSGGKSSFYMSCYILMRAKKLQNSNSVFRQKTEDKGNYTSFIKKLVDYCDENAAALIDAKQFWQIPFYAMARGWCAGEEMLSEKMAAKIKQSLLWQHSQRHHLSLWQKAELIISSLQYAASPQDSLQEKAMDMLENLRQEAITDNENGIRWKKFADNDDLEYGAEETISLLAEAFELAGKNKDVVNGIVKWLMNTRDEHEWSSTKSAAAATELLIKNKTSETAGLQKINLKGDNVSLSATNNLLGGNQLAFSKETMAGNITLQKEYSGPAFGSLHQYYFTDASNASGVSAGVLLQKEWLRLNKTTGIWEKLQPGTLLHIADMVKAVITIETPKNLKYVFLNDARAAAFEPMSQSSGYEYENELSFYKSVKDAGYYYFFDFIPSGRHKFECEMKVANEGEFFNGAAMLQCMYRPEITGYSNTEVFKVGQ